MTREEAIKYLEQHKYANTCGQKSLEESNEAIDMAIEALQTEPIRCGECKHQDECEEVVLFEVNDEEVTGHRLHWCSYAERREP